MVSLIIGAGGLLLVFAGMLALMMWASGMDVGAVITIALGSVVVTAIIVFFAIQLGIGLEEVFSLRE